MVLQNKEDSRSFSIFSIVGGKVRNVTADIY